MGQWKKGKQIKSDTFEMNLVNDSMQMKKNHIFSLQLKFIMNYIAFIID